MLTRHCRYTINYWHWINFAAASLVHAFLEEQRIRIRRRGMVGLHHDRLMPGLHWPGFAGRR
ncbi:hypothetical protein ACPOL_3222 [Acidisarcina polymorpha]|uniref:Uncharacterized protein n=1 Tax=Acidisarcina polymorpha TaxID=2211140 RepID=A0A2Z5G1A9_9BACT|nr:hypothetical protein ACPOL_3222 [Acidisarcina polymorpha]